MNKRDEDDRFKPQKDQPPELGEGDALSDDEPRRQGQIAKAMRPDCALAAGLPGHAITQLRQPSTVSAPCSAFQAFKVV